MYDKNPKLQYDELPKDKIIRPRRVWSRRERIGRTILGILIIILALLLQLLYPANMYLYDSIM